MVYGMNRDCRKPKWRGWEQLECTGNCIEQGTKCLQDWQAKLLQPVYAWCGSCVGIKKKMFCGGDADCVQRESAEVRIPKTQGGFEGHWCMRLAQGNMYWLL